jgi:hypothetical protein
MQDLRFSQQWLWRVLTSGIQHHLASWKSTEVSEDHVPSIFMDSRIHQTRNLHEDSSTQQLAYSSTLKMQVSRSSEISVDFQWTT